MEQPVGVVVPRQPAPPFPAVPAVSRRTGLVTHEKFFWHETPGWVGSCHSGARPSAGIFNQPGKHFENADTKRRILGLVAACGLLDNLDQVSPRMATVEEVARVHTSQYIARIKVCSLHPLLKKCWKGSQTRERIAHLGVIGASWKTDEEFPPLGWSLGRALADRRW